MSKLVLLRGLPGSGKSYTAEHKYPGYSICDADMMPGLYDYSDEGKVIGWHPEKLPLAHAFCKGMVTNALMNGRDAVVANTFTQNWEADTYRNLAKEFGYELIVDRPLQYGNVEILTDDEIAIIHARNTHNVPLDVYYKMRARWEQYPEESNSP